jgi:hypothetical protein
MRPLRTTALIGAALLLAPAALVLSSSPAGAADGDAKVSVFHGIPGVDVNVYVNDKITLTNFKPGDMAGPLSLPAGTYKVQVTSYEADEAAGKKTADVIGPADIPVMSGGNYTIAAHLTTDGKPTATVFENDISKLDAGKGRVTVAHVANAPTVAITANGDTLIESLSNPKSASAVVPAATYKVGVVAGGDTVFSTDLPVTAGANTIVFAYGTFPDTFAVAVQKITGLDSAPTGVPAGEAGLANDASSLPAVAVLAMILAAFGALFAGRRVMARNQA